MIYYPDEVEDFLIRHLDVVAAQVECVEAEDYYWRSKWSRNVPGHVLAASIDYMIKKKRLDQALDEFSMYG